MNISEKPAMVFADPPDNIGLNYDGMKDKINAVKYKYWLRNISATFAYLAARDSTVCWLSINAKYLLSLADTACDARVFNWYFTFGQHRDTDCGNNYRPIIRYAPANKVWNTDAIRIPSARQKMGDKRANPAGRVPGDVWGGPADTNGLCRVQGNNKERLTWHPTQYPEALLERAILMSTNEGDLVFDPFMGTGTTLRVCQRLNRRCITCDISKTYCEKVRDKTGVSIYKE